MEKMDRKFMWLIVILYLKYLPGILLDRVERRDKAYKRIQRN